MLGSTVETNASGIQPLNRARLRHARNRIVLVQRHAGHNAGKLRAAAIHDAVSVGRIRRAEHRERKAAVPEHRSGYLPSVQRVAEQRFRTLTAIDRHTGREVVPDVVVARTDWRARSPGIGDRIPPAENGRNPPFETVSMQWLQV